MPRIQYEKNKISPEHMSIIRQANKILDEMAKEGYTLTLRQLFYQFVSRDLFPESWADPATGSTNNEKSYDKLGNIVSKARMNGLLDWEAIIDMTRALKGDNVWNHPAGIVADCEHWFNLDLWKEQGVRPEVWIEKDAAVGIVEPICRELRLPYFSCRGYTSQSAMWAAGQRLLENIKNKQTPIIMHLGDHDPSGIDMSRDVEDRLTLFIEKHLADADITGLRANKIGKTFVFARLALNMDQIELYKPPPNPTKITDSRARKYIEEFGTECWELDALKPSVVNGLIRDTVSQFTMPRLWEASLAKEKNAKRMLREASGKMALETLK